MIPGEDVEGGGHPEGGWLSVRGDGGARSGDQAEVVVKSVVLLSTILEEVTVAHCVVSHIVAYSHTMCAMDSDAPLEVVMKGVVDGIGGEWVDLPCEMPVDRVAPFNALLTHPGQLNSADPKSVKSFPCLHVSPIGVPVVSHYSRHLML